MPGETVTQNQDQPDPKAHATALSLVIQAGGESKRMGQDKGLVTFRGQPLVQRLVQRLSSIAAEVLVTTNNLPGYAFLELPLCADLLPGTGALGGLYTALSAAQFPAVAVVGCDMPFASAELLAYQHARLLSTGADLVIPRLGDKLEPFHAVYRRETCLPLAQAALEAGKRRVDSWFGQANLRYIDPQESTRFDPSGLAFWNVNTLEELAQAEALNAD
jgi:molybdopterin-guanine dinucleotide biosynthesis protein A